MEGLLPLVYKAIKKNRTRRQYQCLSSGATLGYDINMAEIYPQSERHIYQTHPTQISGFSTEKNGHRRHKTVGDFAYGFSSSQQRTSAGSASPKQLVRFRSQRMFSCITAV